MQKRSHQRMRWLAFVSLTLCAACSENRISAGDVKSYWNAHLNRSGYGLSDEGRVEAIRRLRCDASRHALGDYAELRNARRCSFVVMFVDGQKRSQLPVKDWLVGRSERTEMDRLREAGTPNAE